MGEYMPGHRVEWTVSGEMVHGAFSCDATEGAGCRLVCGEECGSETIPCSSWDEAADEDREHELVDGGYCNVLVFLGEGTAGESFDGEDHRADSGPIVIDWVDDHYTWRYPGQAPPCPICRYKYRSNPDCRRCKGTGRVGVEATGGDD